MNFQRHYHTGFTLVEILVVMALIAILMTSVALNVGLGVNDKPEEVLDLEARRLWELSRLAEDQAILTGEPIGLVIEPPERDLQWRYQWRRYRGNQWVETAAPLSGQALPENLEIALEVEGQSVIFERARQAEEEEQVLEPSILFYPGGEITPFLLTLFDSTELDQRAQIGTARTGRVEIVPEDENLWSTR